MGFEDGKVILDHSSHAYYSGQTISGQLSFSLDKGKTIHGIYVEAKGFCKVHWKTKHWGMRYTYTVDHDSHEQYFRKLVFLCGAHSGEYRLLPGHHEFRFEFPIPVNCPSSFEGTYGYIRYCFKIVMITCGIFSFNKKIIVPFQVHAPLDLNRNPYCRRPIEFQLDDSYSCWCISAGFSQVLVKLPVGGYCPGQVIPIEVTCKNESTVKINKIVFTIKRAVQFIAISAPGTRKTKGEIALVEKGPILAGTTCNWIVDFQVPTKGIYNLNACNFIKINYFFKVSTKIGGCHSGLSQSQPIVLGTIPLVGFQTNMQNPPLEGTSCYPPSPVINQPRYPVDFPGNSSNQESASHQFPMGESSGLQPIGSPPSYWRVVSTPVPCAAGNVAGATEKKPLDSIREVLSTAPPYNPDYNLKNPNDNEDD